MPIEHCLQRPQQLVNKDFAMKCMTPDCGIPIENERCMSWLMKSVAGPLGASSLIEEQENAINMCKRCGLCYCFKCCNNFILNEAEFGQRDKVRVCKQCYQFVRELNVTIKES